MALLSRLSKAQLRDRIRGCLMGSAVGDGYGLSTEFMPTALAARYYGNGPIAFGREPGYPFWEGVFNAMSDWNDFTDDTDQMLVILQSLQQTRDGKLNPINFAKRLVEWLNYGIPELGTEPGRGLGFTVGQVLDHRQFQDNPHFAAFDVWNSMGRNLAANGAVMRTSVIGIESFWDEGQVVENSLAAAKVTHADPRSIVSALISSVLISRLLRGGGLDKSIDENQPWNPRLSDPAYRQELLSYLERGTDLQGQLSLRPSYDPETSANRFQPKNYEALKQTLNPQAARNVGTEDEIEQNRPNAVLRKDIGWKGIDNVGEDEPMGALARSVVSDYKFLVQQTNVAPPPKNGVRSQDIWAAELESHCFPEKLRSLELGNPRAIGYTYKCVGVSFYGATRRIDPSPTLPEYGGSAGLFRGVLEQVTLEGGDADTNDAVLGSLLGARFGLEQGIPSGWWTELKHVNWLNATFDEFLERVLANYEAAQHKS